MSEKKEETVGEIIAQLFDEYLEHYEDEHLASLAAAATINDLLTRVIEPIPIYDRSTKVA